MIHVTLGMEELARNPVGGMAALEYFLRTATARHQQGEIEVVRVSQLAVNHAERMCPAGCRSALRAA
jgi:hypothetical protein